VCKKCDTFAAHKDTTAVPESEEVALKTLKQEATSYQSRLRQGRLDSKLPLAVVAKAMGKTVQYVSQFELGRNQLTVEQFLLACSVLRLRTEWVLHGRGAMFAGEPQAPKRGRAAKRTPTQEETPATPAPG
jgi:transcriptional regulator with XRE-family HTH domain